MGLRLYVPTNGDQLRLTADWTFTLYSEEYGDRNKTLQERLGNKKVERGSRWGGKYMGYPAKTQVTLPAGTILQVDRVYIRKGNARAGSVDADYDSLTFQIIGHPTWTNAERPAFSKNKKVFARFWAKLRDVNTIEFEHAAPPR